MGKIRSLFRLRRSKSQHSSSPPSPSTPSSSSPSSVSGDLERVFNKFDSNGDGKISSEELAAMLASLGHPPSEEELRRMMVEADSDGDGFISLEEFLEINAPPASTDEDLRLAFAVFDVDRNGVISADEISRVLSGIGEGASVDQCRRMIQGVDRDGDGLISFEEFKAMMTSGAGFSRACAALAAAHATAE
ncbi:putative calcium-binding protein CML15 [Curcuma longa]|uniref:putative calcium-binding protein CML15 n=1 Tax=Curcuma longa TaxID=136217 RepID=UPI003D9DF606